MDFPSIWRNYSCLVYTYDADERAILAAALRHAGIGIHRQATLTEILHKWTEQPADLLIVALHETNVVETVKQIRHLVTVPLITIINPLDEDRQVALAEAGVDLLVQRPYSTRLLLAQLRNLAQRNHLVPSAQPSLTPNPTLQIDPLARTLSFVNGNAVRLTEREFQIFHLLYIHQGQVLTLDQLVEYIWGWGDPANNSSLRTLISRLRTKLAIAPENLLAIESIAGIGYRMQLNIVGPNA